MNLKNIITLTKKDLTLFFKNRFFSLITILGLVAYLIIYFALPKTQEDKIKIGIYSEVPLTRVYYFLEKQKVMILQAKSVNDLQKLIERGEISFGLYFPENIERSKLIKIFINSNTEEEMKEAYEYIAKELYHTEFGYFLNIESENEIIGVDMAGKQIPTSKRLIPVFAFFLIVTETLGLANLISEELENKTIFALLSTPVTIGEIFFSKSIIGLITTLIPSILFTIITTGFKSFPLIFLILFLGSLFSISIGFLIGSIANDMMSIIGYGFLVFVIFLIPSFNILAPGSLTGWVKLIPSHYITDALHKIINFSSSLEEINLNILILIFTSAILFLFGSFFLKRRLT
ncbi:MAG: ABC transporter permease [Caldisericia bacterium]|nr:ABC transporter permease [Caldisericia bacterium]